MSDYLTTTLSVGIKEGKKERRLGQIAKYKEKEDKMNAIIMKRLRKEAEQKMNALPQEHLQSDLNLQNSSIQMNE